MLESQTTISGHFSCKHCGHLSETDIYDIYKELSTAVHWSGNIWNDGLCNVLAELHYHILDSYLHNKPRNKNRGTSFKIVILFKLKTLKVDIKLQFPSKNKTENPSVSKTTRKLTHSTFIDNSL